MWYKNALKQCLAIFSCFLGDFRAILKIEWLFLAIFAEVPAILLIFHLTTLLLMIMYRISTKFIRSVAAFPMGSRATKEPACCSTMTNDTSSVNHARQASTSTDDLKVKAVERPKEMSDSDWRKVLTAEE